MNKLQKFVVDDIHHRASKSNKLNFVGTALVFSNATLATSVITSFGAVVYKLTGSYRGFHWVTWLSNAGREISQFSFRKRKGTMTYMERWLIVMQPLWDFYTTIWLDVLGIDNLMPKSLIEFVKGIPAPTLSLEMTPAAMKSAARAVMSSTKSAVTYIPNLLLSVYGVVSKGVWSQVTLGSLYNAAWSLASNMSRPMALVKGMVTLVGDMKDAIVEAIEKESSLIERQVYDEVSCMGIHRHMQQILALCLLQTTSLGKPNVSYEQSLKMVVVKVIATMNIGNPKDVPFDDKQLQTDEIDAVLRRIVSTKATRERGRHLLAAVIRQYIERSKFDMKEIKELCSRIYR